MLQTVWFTKLSTIICFKFILVKLYIFWVEWDAEQKRVIHKIKLRENVQVSSHSFKNSFNLCLVKLDKNLLLQNIHNIVIL